MPVLDVGQDRLERGDVAVDVRDDGDPVHPAVPLLDRICHPVSPCGWCRAARACGQRDSGVRGHLRSTLIGLTTALDEGLECPHEMGQVDPVHRRAVADVLLEEGDPLPRELLGEPLDQVGLGADDPGRAVGAAAMVLMIFSVEPTSSANSTTS